MEVDGRPVSAHVKTTGRCRELLVPGAGVWLESHESAARKTPYSLIAVKKGDRLVNIDSQAPNQIFEEALLGGLSLPGFGSPGLIKREAAAGRSRLDFYLESGGKRGYAEVKGVTLEENGAARFPDAPTERGVRHLEELMALAGQGFAAFAVFIIQTEKVDYFVPNWRTHPLFGETLRKAAAHGVVPLAYDCSVFPDEVVLKSLVEIRL